MKFRHLFFIFCCLMVVMVACHKDPTGPDEPQYSDAEMIALDLLQTSGWDIEDWVAGKKYTPKTLPSFNRQVLSGDIVHYSFRVPAGTGLYDVIGIHRVVKEKKEGQPIKTKKNIFLQHGDVKDFTGMFLNGVRTPHIEDDFGIAIFLARNDIDVWGIDQNWALVPQTETNFSYMKDWGMENQAQNLHFALEIAHLARIFTGCGNNTLNLLGYSSGVLTGYAVLNEEAVLPRNKRVVGGWIPVDCAFKCDDPLWKEVYLEFYDYYKSLWDAGTYADIDPFPIFGQPARDDPDAPSANIEGLTNLQAALAVSALPSAPLTYHYFAGVMDNEMPIDFKYVSIDEALDFMIDSVPYEATRFEVDYCATISDAVDVPWDDNLFLITVPVFNVAAAGGFGERTTYTPTLLGSTDRQNLLIRLEAVGEEALDFAHIDLFLSHNAEALVWTPILNWLQAH